MSKKILWLDNDPDYLEPYIDALSDEHYEVRRVSTVAEAEQLLHAEKYDLLILDVMIPTKDAAEEERYRPTDTKRGARTGMLFYVKNREYLVSVGTRVLVMTVRLDAEIVSEFAEAGLDRKWFATKYEVRDVSDFLKKVVARLNGEELKRQSQDEE